MGKKLRKLATVVETPVSGKVVASRLVGLCILITVLFCWIAQNPMILDNFISCYLEQYHFVVHGVSDYCTQQFNVRMLLNNIRHHIHGQDVALDVFKNILNSHKTQNVTFIALIGTTGVGKTHFINLIRKYYPWQDNIHHYVWSTFNESPENKYAHISQFVKKLSACGNNIILIDDLSPNEKNMALEYQKMTELELANSNRLLKLVVIFVFNIIRYTETMQREYATHFETLQNLGSIKTVNFQELTSLDVRNCIVTRASKLAVNLNEEQIVSILNSIDADKVGCKNVHAMITKF